MRSNPGRVETPGRLTLLMEDGVVASEDRFIPTRVALAEEFGILT